MINIKRKQIKKAIYKAINGGPKNVAPLGWSGEETILHGTKNNGRCELIKISIHSGSPFILITDRCGHFLIYNKYCKELGVDNIARYMHQDIANVMHMIKAEACDYRTHKKISKKARYKFLNQ